MTGSRSFLGKRTGTSALVVPNVSSLGRVKPVGDAIVYVAGYHTPGDGGAMFLCWDKYSNRPVDGGLVFGAGKVGGRWLQLHDGVVDFRKFGIMGPDTPADDALDAMVAEPTIERIEAHSDLNFVKRHVFDRSGIEIDFQGHLVTTDGIEKNTHDNPFGAVMFFTGKTTGQALKHTITSPMAELVDIFEVGSSSPFAVGQWWTVTVNNLEGKDERELQLMVEVIEIMDAKRIRVGYKTGWPFGVGRTFSWHRVEPVRDVSVGDFQFIGSGPYGGPVNGELPDERELTGSHPVAYEYAVNCHARDIHAERTWWPVVMRRWNSTFSTTSCSIKNPPTVFYGGAGYLTQQIYCMYGSVSDCTSSNARHLNDLTASAYCQVKNCHGDGDDAGGNPFTTHGQYEHDLLFEGCSDLMDIANSGGQWGTSAKRITVKRHTCSWFVAGTKITDLTLEDVIVLPRPTFDPAATLAVNADGLQMRGCRGITVAIGQRSNRSTRPNVIEGCHFSLPPKQVLVQTPVSNPVTFRDCLIEGIDSTTLRGAGEVRFDSCRLVGAGDESIMQLGSEAITLRDTSLERVSLDLLATRDQRLALSGGTTVAATAKSGTVTRADTASVVSVVLDGATLASADSAGPAVNLAAGTNHLRVTDSRLTGGGLSVAGDASTALVARSILKRCPTTLPAEPAAVIADSLTLN